MDWLSRVRFLHRAWRYRLRSEKFAISYLLTRDLAGKTVVDIGANWGIYSYWLHGRVGSTGRVIAFEPQPELCDHLRILRDRFPLSRLEIVEAGLSSEPGELRLQRPKRHWGGASFEQRWRDGGDCDSIPVRVTTLDAHFGASPARPVGFVKCDVEGHEHRTLQGARKILSEDRPELLFECHDAENPRCASFELLRELDYEGFCFCDGGLAPVSQYAALRSRIHRRALVDFVFMPKEKSFELARLRRDRIATNGAKPSLGSRKTDEAAVARAEAA